MRPDGKTILLVSNGSNQDIRNVLESLMPISKRQTLILAKRFKGKTDFETCYNVWKFLKRDIRYIADGKENQDIRLPLRLISSKIGDCKSFSLFAASILTNLKINCLFTYASYNEYDRTPTHVYITTSNGTIVDGVLPEFNYEKPPTYKQYKRI